MNWREKKQLPNDSILLRSGEVKLVTETKYHSCHKLKILTSVSAELQMCVEKKIKKVIERSSWCRLSVWLPHRSLLPCLQGKQDSARVLCFMSWSQPKSPHSHRHCAKGRDHGHAAAAAKPQEAWALRILTHTVCFYIYMHTSDTGRLIQ